MTAPVTGPSFGAEAPGFGRRDVLRAAGLFTAGSLWCSALPAQDPATAKVRAPPAIDRDLLQKGLDGLGRAAEDGNDLFTEGHVAAAVLAAAFFQRDNGLDDGAQAAFRTLVDGRLLSRPIFAPHAKERAEPALVDALVAQLDGRIHALRGSGHDIIFAALSLRALRELPDAATPSRLAGLRAMLDGFGAVPARTAQDDPLTFPADEAKFVGMVFDEYLAALDLYLRGRGHHGFAGHVLTIGHALLELSRLGHPVTARKGLQAWRQFVARARRGDDLGGARVPDAPPGSPPPLQRDYWLAQARRRTAPIVSSHVVKYPYSFYALLKELPDDAARQRVLAPIHHLTAVS